MKESGDLFALGRLVADRQDALMDGALADAGQSVEGLRQRVAAHAETRHASRRPRLFVAWALPTAAVVVAAITAVGLLRTGAEPAVTFTVGEPPVAGAAGKLISAPGDRALSLHFSERTAVLLHPEARGRIVGLSSKGADLILESGRARLDVTPNQGGHWSVRAGPFVVRVKGTKFETAYDPDRKTFSLQLFEGHVIVSGCGFGDGRVVAAGERVESTCTDPLPEPGRATPSWIALARKARYDDAYELAREDFERECRAGDAEHLWLLADVARLSGHSPEARRAYVVLRDRFAGTPASADAAFALGRLALQDGGDRVAAERWFERHLAERPTGPLASVAFVRLMEIRRDRGDQRGAADVARRYLERFPSGPHVSEARRLLNPVGTARR